MHRTEPGHVTRSSTSLGARLWLGVGVLAALTGAAGGSAPLSSQELVPVAAPASPLTSDWVETCLAIIKRLYQLMGGDPHYLDGLSLSAAMGATTNYYNANGCPANLTEAERAAGRADVEAAYSMTDPPAPESATAVGTAFRAMLRSLYADLGGDPNTL